MKIEQIYIKNFTSLKGEHIISLPKSGLMAITGPTGAGKSSILDAITLALFGKIKRYEKQGSASDAPYISKGTLGCEVKVLFSINNQRFIARFEWHRAKKSHKLQASPNRAIISVLSGDLKEGLISSVLASKARECDALITRILGLNYESFISAVLLPQGHFANFLLSEDKSALLAVLANLKIYEAIGRLAYEDAKETKKRLAELEFKIENAANLQDLNRAKKQLKRATLSKRFSENKAKALEARKLAAKLQEDFKKEANEFLSNCKSVLNVLAKTDFSKLKDHEQYLQANELNTTLSKQLKSLINSAISAIYAKKLLLKEPKRLLKKLDELNEFKDLNLEQNFKDKNEIFNEAKNLANEANVKAVNELKEAALGLIKDLLANINAKLNSFIKIELEEKYQKLQMLDIRLNESLSSCKIARHDDLAKQKLALDNEQKFLEEKLKKELSEYQQLLDSLKDEQLKHHANEIKAATRLNEPCLVCGAIVHELPKISKHLDVSERIKKGALLIGAKSNELASVDLVFKERIDKLKALEIEHKNYELAQMFVRSFKELNYELDIDQIISSSSKIKASLMLEINSLNTDLKPLNKIDLKTVFNVEFNELNEANLEHLKANLIACRMDAGFIFKCEQLIKDFELSKNIAKLERLKVLLKHPKNLLDAYNIELKRLNSYKHKLSLNKQAANESIISFKMLSNNDLSEQIARLNALKNAKKCSNYDELKALKNNLVLELNLLHRYKLNFEHKISKDKLDELFKIKLSQAQFIKYGKAQQNYELISQSYEKSLLIKEQIELITSENKALLELAFLIGDSKGERFNSLAQMAVLRLVCELANSYLEKIYPRYEISLGESLKEPLLVRDFQAGATKRICTSLSGGETFVISLSLALALTKLASKRTKLDVLFIDEGFGSLDESSLKIALNALISLAESEDAKLISIISHVPNLLEQIGKGIKIVPNNDGSSRIIND